MAMASPTLAVNTFDHGKPARNIPGSGHTNTQPALSYEQGIAHYIILVSPRTPVGIDLHQQTLLIGWLLLQTGDSLFQTLHMFADANDGLVQVMKIPGFGCHEVHVVPLRQRRQVCELAELLRGRHGDLGEVNRSTTRDPMAEPN